MTERYVSVREGELAGLRTVAGVARRVVNESAPISEIKLALEAAEKESLHYRIDILERRNRYLAYFKELYYEIEQRLQDATADDPTAVRSLTYRQQAFLEWLTEFFAEHEPRIEQRNADQYDD